jgi:thermitase
MKKSRTTIFLLELVLLTVCLASIVFSLMQYSGKPDIAYAAGADTADRLALMNPEKEIAAQPIMAEPEKAVPAFTRSSNDPYFDRQWALSKINMLPAADNEKARIITVAVLDTGVDASHEDLQGVVKGNICFSDSNTSSDINGHGTHISGIIAAVGDNGIGIAGAAPNVRILNVKVAEDNGMVWASNVADGVRWAVDNGADVINMSLAAASASKELQSAVEYAWQRGVVLVAAAGNYTKAVTYPAAFPQVIGVAAICQDGTLWAESDDGDFVDAYAPGADIISTLPGNKYGYYNGSSMAAAYISAFAATALNEVEDSDGDGLYNDEVAALIRDLFGRQGL